MARILVAVDESDASERVAAFVNDFFAHLDVEILAVNVARTAAPWIPPQYGYGWVYPWAFWDDPSIAGARDVDEAARQLVDEGEQTVIESGLREDETIVEVGDPAAAIERAARERDADMIVVGSNHRSLFERLFSPSVSKEVLQESERPVLVVP